MTVWSPRKACEASAAPGKRFVTSVIRSAVVTAVVVTAVSYVKGGWPGLAGGSPAGGVLVLNLGLQLHQAVEDHFGPGRAAGDVNIDGEDGVDAHDGGVVVVEASGAGADAEGDDPLGLSHLVVDALKDRGHLVADRADDEEDVGLARGKPGEARAEAIDVVVGAGGRHVLHAAAGGDEGVLEDGVFAGPAEGRVEATGDERVVQHAIAIRHCHFRAPLSQA